MRFIQLASRQAAPTTDRLGSAIQRRVIRRDTTQRSCSIRTATTWRPSSANAERCVGTSVSSKGYDFGQLEADRSRLGKREIVSLGARLSDGRGAGEVGGRR